MADPADNAKTIKKRLEQNLEICQRLDAKMQQDKFNACIAQWNSFSDFQPVNERSVSREYATAPRSGSSC